MSSPLRVLHVVPDMNAGGIENYIINMYRGMDTNEIQFDFLVHHSRRAFFDNEIEERGGRIYRLTVLDNKNVLNYHSQLSDLFTTHDWRIVHGHAASLAYFYLGAAERSGVPVRIAHSHGTSFLRTPKGYAKRLLFKSAKIHANVRLACSTEAGKYLFGKDSFYLAKNAIDSARFKFDPIARSRQRRCFGIGDKDLLIGHIGRFNLQKNHRYLVEVFSEVLKIKENAYLILVGSGELEQEIRKQVGELGISDKVIFQPVTKQPEAIYSALDVFLLPSLFEGLPLVGIEAQCSGLPCFFSSEITRETAISPLAHFLDLEAGPVAWAQTIVSTSADKDRIQYASMAAKYGFESTVNNEKMRRFYLEVAERGVNSIDSLLG